MERRCRAIVLVDSRNSQCTRHTSHVTRHKSQVTSQKERQQQTANESLMSKHHNEPFLEAITPSIERYDAESSKDTATPVAITRATYIYVLCAAVNSCNLGYDVGVSTNAGPKIRQEFNLSNVQLELFLGSINLWSMFGALLAQHVSDTYGRRKTFIMAASGFILGVAIMSVAPSYEILMFGRFFVGMGVGAGLAIDPSYIAEVSPA